MLRSLPLLAGILVGGILLGACDGGSTPTTPTPTATVTPPPAPPPPPPPPPAPAALASLTLNPATIVSQGNPEGTVTLTAAAPAGDAVVALESGNPDLAKVPANVTVRAGSTSNTFRVETSTVGTNSTVTIIATYAGVTQTAPLMITPPPLEPRFTVTSDRGADACDIINTAGAVNCQFNASTSAGIVAKYLWSMKVGSSEASFSAADGEAVVTPITNCGLLGNGTSEDGRISMDVSLQLEDRSGTRSGVARRTIAVHHNQRCGY